MFFDGFDIGSGRGKKPIDNEGYYKTLGVPKTANKSQIKKAYYTLAKKHHPDKGGDEQTFKKLQLAFEVLQDDEKRMIYDKYGEDGLKSQSGAPSTDNLFDFLVGRGRNRVRKGKDSVFELGVTLEDIYNQANKKLKFTKNAICTKCKGTGTKSGKSTDCSACNGRGVIMRTKQIGPGMITQTQSPCMRCRGTGEVCNKADRCEDCKGKKIVEKQKIVEVLIEKGVESGHRYVFEGEADERPGILPGDIIVKICEQKHKTFGREGMNLFFKKCITLSDALCGAEFSIKHLDGRILKISTHGTIVSPREVRCIENEGMPLHSRSFIKGALFLMLDVTFPSIKDISPGALEKIKTLLNQPSKPLVLAPGSYEEPVVVNKTVEEVRNAQKVYTSKSTEEDDEEEISEHTNCRAQ